MLSSWFKIGRKLGIHISKRRIKLKTLPYPTCELLARTLIHVTVPREERSFWQLLTQMTTLKYLILFEHILPF